MKLRQPVRSQFARRQPHSVIKKLVHRPVQRLHGDFRSAGRREMRQRPDGFEPHLRMIVRDTLGEQLHWLLQPRPPLVCHPNSGGAGTMIASVQQLAEQLWLHDVE